MKKLAKRISRKEWGMILLAILFTCFSVYLELEVPTYISKITDLLGTQGTSLDELWQPAGMMVGMSFFAFLSAVAVGFFASRVAASYTSRLRSDIFNRVLDYSQTEIKKFSIPSLLTRTTNDITQVQMLITMGLQVVTRGPIMAIWAIGKILGHSEYWLWAVLVAVIVNVLMTTVLMTLAFPKQSLIQSLTDKLNSITRESLTGIRVVRAYNAEEYQNEKFAAANDELTRLNLFVNRLMAILNPIMMGISSGLSVAIYWIGAYVINDAAPIARLPLFSDMIVFMSYAMQVVMGFLLMGALFIVLPRTMVSAKRINQVLDLHSSIQNPAQVQLADENLKGQVEFKDVTFRYAANSEAVIENVSFRAEAGQTVAFIGSTGSGKSTLVNLIPRFYDVTKGSILIDGINIKNVRMNDLRSLIGYVNQEPILFNDTIFNNIAFGVKDAGMDQVIEAAKIANAHEFIMEKPDGYNTNIGDRGMLLSGGQRQRISIARAILKNPPILILDEATASLDTESERLVQEALDRLMSNRTTIAIAHRLSTIKNSDEILVMQEGEIVERGRHEDLLALGGYYKKLNDMQAL